jgi:DNA-binding GntR family transcriptional regulator
MMQYQDETARGRHLAGIAVIAETTGAADELERERLKLVAGEVVVRVTRIRSEDDKPTSYELSVLPLGRFRGLIPEGNVHEDIVTLARAHGVAVGRATEVLDTAYATTDVAEYLGIDPDEAVERLDRVVHCARGLPIEWRVTFIVP